MSGSHAEKHLTGDVGAHRSKNGTAATGHRNDLGSLLGIEEVRKLYLQLQYRCNFSCTHCFHGSNLQRDEVLPPDNVMSLLERFVARHGTRTVCLLGGEPLLYPHLVIVAKRACELNLKVEICTNGYRREPVLRAVLPYTHLLRVSLDGDEPIHDAMRRRGSFEAAIRTLAVAQEMNVPTGITVTLTADNVRTMPAMHSRIVELGVSEIVFHRMRLVGNAATNRLPDIGVEDARWLERNLLATAPSIPTLRLDSDILALLGREFENPVITNKNVDRIEISPDGKIYLSCKVVGSHMNSFQYAIETDEIVYTPHAEDEVRRGVRQVRYVG